MLKSKKSKKARSIRKLAALKKPYLLIFAATFALAGGYVILVSFAAAAPQQTIEAENMDLPQNAYIFSDSSASNGQAVALSGNGTASFKINTSFDIKSATLHVKAAQCDGYPSVSMDIDDKAILASTTVPASSWASYNTTVNLGPGSHVLFVSASNLGYVSQVKSCQRTLYLDDINIYGP